MTNLENENLLKLEAFFRKIKNILKECEGIIGKDSLNIISDFLFLKLLKVVSKENKFLDEMIKYNYNSKKANNNKLFLNWEKIINIVEKIKKNQTDEEELFIITKTIFNKIFKLYPKTKDLFNGRKFQIKKSLTLIKIYEEYDKIEFEKKTIDIKGKVYESIIQEEASNSKNFGQFFTPRWIIKYMIGELDLKIDKNGNFDNIMDPACGTGGFLTEYYKYIKTLCDKNNITISKDLNKKLHGFEIIPKTRELALINVLLNVDSYNDNIIKPDDFIHFSKDFIKNKFKGNILTNPPLIMENDYSDMFTGTNQCKIFPVKTKSPTLLFLQACVNIIENDYNIYLISPNGKEISGKCKDYIEIRKNTMEICNLHKIALLPFQSFKPYSNIETLILFMKKGTSTKEVKFVQLINNEGIITEKELAKVEFEKFEHKNFSWNYKDYYVENTLKYVDTLRYETLNNVCDITYGTRMLKSNSSTQYMQYPIYGKNNVSLYCNDFNREGNTCVISKCGISSNCVKLIKGKFWLNDHGFSISSKDEKYLSYDYLKYVMLLNQENIFQLYEISTQKNLDINKFKLIQIPIIPFEVQKQIITELDSYYKTKETIQSQLDEMLQFKKGKFEMLVEQSEKTIIKKLGHILKVQQGEYITKKDSTEGKIPIYGESCICGYTKKSNNKNKFIISKDSVRENCVKYVSGNFFLNHHGWFYKLISNDVTYDYVGFFLLNSQSKLFSLANGPGQKGLYQDLIYSLEINIPSKQDQERIVKEIKKDDKLEKLLKNKIIELDIIIENRFNHYMNKCGNIKKYNSIEIHDQYNLSDNFEQDNPMKKIQISKNEQLNKNKQIKKCIKKINNNLSDESENEKPVKRKK